MIVRQGRVIFCKTSEDFAAEGSVVSSIGSGWISWLAAISWVTLDDCRARADCFRDADLSGLISFQRWERAQGHRSSPVPKCEGPGAPAA